MEWFQNKRKQIAKALPENSALILESLPIYFRQPDVAYPYRQESHFYYLTGFKEPESLFILKKDLSVLFIQKKDLTKEVWDGYRYTTREAREIYLMDKVHTIDKGEEKLPLYLKDIKTLYLNAFNDELSFPKGIKIESAGKFLAPFRQIKDSFEIAHIKEAVNITAKAHRQVALALKPGVSEQTLHGIFIKTLMENGSKREGYSSIVACGNNATVMHYTKNQTLCRKGELLLLDAGGEKNYYTADITRVYPVSGIFSREQKTAYERLLILQKSLIKKIRPQTNWKTLTKRMVEGVTQILLDLNILKGSLSENIRKRTYKTYLPHGLGHQMGLDVHDSRLPKGVPLILKSGMIVTVEPGIYFPESCPVKAFRGMGLRIEDDILVTPTGQENLSCNIPKEVDEIQAVCSS